MIVQACRAAATPSPAAASSPAMIPRPARRKWRVWTLRIRAIRREQLERPAARKPLRRDAWISGSYDPPARTSCSKPRGAPYPRVAPKRLSSGSRSSCSRSDRPDAQWSRRATSPRRSWDHGPVMKQPPRLGVHRSPAMHLHDHAPRDERPAGISGAPAPWSSRRWWIPDYLAGLGVERDDMRVGGRGDQLCPQRSPYCARTDWRQADTISPAQIALGIPSSGSPLRR